MSHKPSLAVIGAGMSGLSFARAIEDHAQVTLFEKSRGVAGRMAARKRDGFVFDHGAQYFTARDKRFRAALDAAISRGAIVPWDISFQKLTADGTFENRMQAEPRFVGVPSMTALVKFWAADQEVVLDKKIIGITGERGEWYLTFEDTALAGPFDWVISTAPAPQMAALLPLNKVDAADVAAVHMDGCFTLMLSLPKAINPGFSACQVDHPIIGWIACNETKSGRGDKPCLVVHANNGWSADNIDAALPAIQERMLEALRELLPSGSLDYPAHIDLHRWRYANVKKPLGRPFLLDAQQGIAACGDWCLGNRVEAAFMSGALLADALIEQWNA